MQFRRFRLLAQDDIGRFEQAVKSVVPLWADGWFAPEAACQLRCVRPDEYDARREFAGATALVLSRPPGQDLIALYAPALDGRDFMRLLIGVEPAGGVPEASALLSQMRQQCLVELGAEMASAISGDVAWRTARPSAEPVDVDALWSRGSGGLLVECAIGRSRIAALLSPGLLDFGPVARSAGLEADLTPRRAAIGGQRLRVQINAGEVELELALLQTIRVGDVIKLAASCEEPLRVTNEAGDTICTAFLGMQDEFKAVQLGREP